MKKFISAAVIAASLISTSAVAGAGAGSALSDSKRFAAACDTIFEGFNTRTTLSEALDSGICHGVIGAVVNIMTAVKNTHDAGEEVAELCIPDHYIGGNGIQIVTNYAKENPELLEDTDPTIFVLMALYGAYECKS